jgi:uncharacterized protein (DUF2252 family)
MPRHPKPADPNPPHVQPRRPLPGLTAREERFWGRTLRAETPRRSFGLWEPAADRPDPIAILAEQARSRVVDLIPIRHGRMLVSPFTFYRGAAAVMTADLARMPASGIFVQACGDAHLSNFGLFNTTERLLIFDVNDFDETYPAPFEWDVLRLAASAAIAARDNGFPDSVAQTAARTVGTSYREQILNDATLPWLDVWFSRTHPERYYQTVLRAGEKRIARRIRALLDKAYRRDHLGALDRFAYNDNGTWRIRAEPPLITEVPGTTDDPEVVAQALRDYVESLPPEFHPFTRRYRVVDVARKVVGVGSVGTEAYIILFIGDNVGQPVFLQAKEAGRSVLELYTEPDIHEHQGQRIVFGQRLMQAASDPFLGWFRGTGPRALDYYVRQLRDGKASLDINTLFPAGLVRYVEVCAQVLARAHARSGEAPAIAGYLGTGKVFDKAVEAFAMRYADQTIEDHAALVAAVAGGRIEAITGL